MADLFRVADARTRLRSFGHAALIVVAAFLVGIVLSAIGLGLFQAAGYTLDSDFAVVFVTTSALQFLGFLLAVGWYFRAIADFDDIVHYDRPGLREAGWAILGLVTLLGSIAAIGAILTRFGLEPAPNNVIDVGREDPLVFLLLVPVTILFVAPGEELVFRGVVQGQLRRAYGVLPGILIASAIFGLVHLPALGTEGSIYVTIAVIVAAGLLLGAVYELSGNILVSIAVHALWNVTVFLANYVEVTGLF